MGPSPRLRIFAGPNGSGKSTLKDVLKPAWLGFYLNPDDLQREITAAGLNLGDIPVAILQVDIDRFWQSTTILPEEERVIY